MIFSLIFFELFLLSFISFVYYFKIFIIIKYRTKKGKIKQEKNFEEKYKIHFVKCEKHYNKNLEKAAHKFYYNQKLKALKEYVISPDHEKFYKYRNCYFGRFYKEKKNNHKYILNIISIYFYHFQEYGRMEFKNKENLEYSLIFDELNNKNVEYTGIHYFTPYFNL